jgi:hypothetical protein
VTKKSEGWKNKKPDKPKWLLDEIEKHKRWERGEYTNAELDDICAWLATEAKEEFINKICWNAATKGKYG